MGRPVSGMAWVAGLVVFFTVVGAFTVLGMEHGEDFFIPTIVLGGITVAVVLRGPLGKAIAQRIQYGQAGAEASPEVLQELDDLRGRVMELEERLDFAERLLSQPRAEASQAQLPG